jgi:prophage antirepressor-like protein
MEIVKAFNSNELHTDIVIKGTFEEPLFRTSDIGLILEVANINQNIADFDETEKVSLTTNTKGGNQTVSFLTEKGLYKVLFRSRKPIAETFQNWVCQVIKDIRIKGTYILQQQLADKEQQLEEIKHENIILQKKIEESSDNVPTIYIWNTNTQIKPPELKIGITLNVHKRVKPYKQTNKHGKIEFTIPILNVDIKMFEKVIHSILNPYKVQDEVFKLDVEEAKIVIINFVNFIKLTQITNDSERINKMQKVYEEQNRIINNISPNISKNEIGIQTESTDNNYVSDEIEELQNKIIDTKSDRIKKFKQFIEECCIVRQDVEISSVDILGQYRIWSRFACKKIYHELKSFLDTSFRATRLTVQNKNQVINGYKGITLKEIIYKKQLVSSDIETFIFHSTKFSPNGKVLHSNLLNEYISWKKIVGKEVTNKEDEEIKTYLKLTNYTLFTTIWSSNGSGQGYYGIYLKSEDMNHRKTSSTGKCVEKRKYETDELLGTWETIAKAADSEKISPTKLSRCIKIKTIFQNDYYYKTV